MDTKLHEESLKATGRWTPKTKLGKMVKEGKVRTVHEAIESGLPFREHQLTDLLMPELYNVPVDVRMVQRMTDSGRRVKFAVTTIIGNCNGVIGVGRAANREIRSAIEKSVNDAKLNVFEIPRGCGSWECGCGRPHTVPFTVTGKSGSVEVTIKPAPRGVGLACSDVVKQVLILAGISDAWVMSKGATKTDINAAMAALNALAKAATVKVTPEQKQRLKIVSGEVARHAPVAAPAAAPVATPAAAPAPAPIATEKKE